MKHSLFFLSFFLIDDFLFSSWKQIMAMTNANPLVINAINPLDSGMTLLDTFLNNNKALESVQKSLEEYLETKRGAFPRFYFLSNDELLEIMSQTRDPHAVQPHMSKCFDAIKRIKFGEGKAKADILGFLGNVYVYTLYLMQISNHLYLCHRSRGRVRSLIRICASRRRCGDLASCI